MLPVLAALLIAALPAAGHGESPPRAATCQSAGDWLTVAAGSPSTVPGRGLIDALATRQVVLLGERHDSAEDHRWQLHSLAQLHARQPDLAVAFEMFPRRVQPVLDRWVAGELSESEFLRQVDWQQVWNFDPRDYLPLFHYARMNRLPMLAANVERTLVARVGDEGWDAVPEPLREGVSRPAPPSAPYLEILREVFARHPARRTGGETAFPRFVEAQTVWDRAMAEVIAGYLRRHPQALVVGIMGVGHVQHGYGVPHQLRDLGVEQIATLSTWEREAPCGEIEPGVADALYVIDAQPRDPPRLGISMQANGVGVRIGEVREGSVAAQAGLRAGDLVLEVAGRRAKGPDDIRLAVQRQPAGTWLPLRVKRADEELELVARFPTDP